ncbi:MAG: alkyl sulfatase dimerization domain-containing protein [Bacillota bacterium]
MGELLRTRWEKILTGSILLLLAGYLLAIGAGCSDERAGQEAVMVEPPDPHAILTEHAKRFSKRVEKVTDGVYVAVGYALANSIMIDTGDGRIIVDTTESLEAAREIRAEFDRISNGPVVAVIYTHGHPDHVIGTMGFIESGEGDTAVIAHETTNHFLSGQFGLLQPVLNQRGIRQFGSYLPDEYSTVIGIGPCLRFDHEKAVPFVFPNRVFADEMTLEVGGEVLHLMHAPGETDDQIMIWMPAKRVLLCGDNYYPAFPNLYTIRGTSPRPVLRWINSLDMMRLLGAEFLVPSHAEPVYGATRIYELLTAYRDAIQYIHDAVVRGANEGKTPAQLVEEIALPPHLADRPELLELYGQVSWSVRAIYDGYLGWFDGNAVNLEPLSSRERAGNIAGLAGGVDKLVEAARAALQEEEYQWAAELADMILILDQDSAEGREIKIEALMKMGEATYNTNARLYYITAAMELAGALDTASRIGVDAEMARVIPLSMIFEHMTIKLDPEAAADVEMAAVFNITDTGEVYSIIVRRGVAELRCHPVVDADLVINVAAQVWKEVALGVSNPLTALATGKIKVEGNKVLLMKKFFDLFTTS